MSEKYTVITGASTGIGHQAALKFAARGKNLIVAARNEAQLNELAEEIKGINAEVKVVVMPVDLSVETEVYKFYEATKAYCVETWINNAGIADLRTIYDQATASSANMAKLNVVATTILSSLYVKDYKNVEGTTLLNTGSQTGYFMGELSVVYSATKFYVNAFTESLWYEIDRDPEAKIRIRLLAPFVTKSKFYERAYGVPGADDALPFGNTSEEMAGFMLETFDGDKCLGDVSPETFSITLRDPRFPIMMNPTK